MHLSLADIRIAEYLLRELGGFSWFNCGQLSGASQPQKHLQHIFGDEFENIPLDSYFNECTPFYQIPSHNVIQDQKQQSDSLQTQQQPQTFNKEQELDQYFRLGIFDEIVHFGANLNIESNQTQQLIDEDEKVQLKEQTRNDHNNYLDLYQKYRGCISLCEKQLFDLGYLKREQCTMNENVDEYFSESFEQKGERIKINLNDQLVESHFSYCLHITRSHILIVLRSVSEFIIPTLNTGVSGKEINKQETNENEQELGKNNEESCSENSQQDPVVIQGNSLGFTGLLFANDMISYEVMKQAGLRNIILKLGFRIHERKE